MYLQHMLGLLLVACSWELCGVSAYPALLPYIYNPTNDHHARNMKRNELNFPQFEDDVMELEQLRNQHLDQHMAVGKRQHETTSSTDGDDEVDDALVEPVMPRADAEDVINHTNTLPDLERQLELATPLIPGTTTTIITTSSNSKEDVEHTQVEEPKAAAKPTQVVEGPPPPSGKAFYGAARLAFGQNPEVLPTSSTTTTTAMPTTTTAASTTTATTAALAAAAQDPSETHTEADAESTSGISDIVGDDNDQPAETIEGAAAVSELAQTRTKSKLLLNKETIGDILSEQLEAAKSTERRSSMQLSPKTAQSLLRNPNGQYSSFDMAQYVFWTGDEAGVARAVEELIDENLISRENALKFLRDIRLGLEFLQRSYANRIFPEELRQNHLKRNNSPTTTTTSTTTTTTTSTTTEKPLPNLHLAQEAETALLPEEPHLSKALDSFTFWNKLRELNNEGRQQDLNDYDEAAGRAKIVEYLYNEYTLEEILYKLAKVMFAQSLAHGSDEAQQELQKLTDFLEREGNMGVIPIDLQKKVLRVLLTALSDTLTEHPELLTAARLNLASPYYRLPIHNTPSH